MKIRWNYIGLGLLTLVIAANIFSAYFRTLTEVGPVFYAFETRNAEFEFVLDPAGGQDVALMEREFQKFLSLHPQTEDRELYRTFEIKPWQFWNWYHFLTSDLYGYPFKGYNTSESF